MHILKVINEEVYEKEINKYNIDYKNTISYLDLEKSLYKNTPIYLGLYNDNKLVTLISLLKVLVTNKKNYLIVTNGYLIDNNDINILSIITDKLIEFAKSINSIYIEFNSKLLINNSNDFKKVITNLNNLNYKKITSTTTDTNIIDLKQNIDSIYNNIKDEIKEIIDLSNDINIEVDIDYNINNYIDNFINIDKNYYTRLFEVFNGNNNTKAYVINIYFNITKTLNIYNKKVKEINNQISIIPIDNLSNSSKEKLSNLRKKKQILIDEINKYKKINNNKKKVIISNHIVTTTNNKAWIINNNYTDILDDNIKYRIHFEIIKYLKNNNIEILYDKLDNFYNNKYIEENINSVLIIDYILYLIYKNKRKKMI